MGFSIRKALRKLDTGARRALAAADDLRRGDVGGATQRLKQAAGVAHTFAQSTFEQARRDVRNVHRAHVDVFLATVKTPPPRDPLHDERFTTLPVPSTASNVEPA